VLLCALFGPERHSVDFESECRVTTLSCTDIFQDENTAMEQGVPNENEKDRRDSEKGDIMYIENTSQ